MGRRILYVDIICFTVSVERAADPLLRSWPVAVAPQARGREVVLAASYEARREGVEAGMPVKKALSRCPGLKLVNPDPGLYAKASRALIRVLAEFSPIVEPARPGHAYLDMTGTDRLFGDPLDTAARIRREVKKRLDLEGSVGLAANKMVSHAAADHIKPEEACSVPCGDEKDFLAPLDVSLIPEVKDNPGAVWSRLRGLNIIRIGELAGLTRPQLKAVFGVLSEVLYARARGIDLRPVCPTSNRADIREVGVMDEDTNDRDLLTSRLINMVSRVGYKLRKGGLKAGRLDLSVLYSDYREMRYRTRLGYPSDLDRDLIHAGRGLLEKAFERRIRVRSMELTLRELTCPPAQGSLFDGRASRQRALQSSIDRLKGRFGEGVVGYGR